MVEEQLVARGIRDPEVLSAMGTLRREVFVPENEKERAYTDGALPIGYGQTISQPYVVAFMTEALKIRKTDRILEIGTGSGYQATVLAKLSREVFSIEIIEPLAARARVALAAEGLSNVEVRTGDGYRGWPERAPFDAIIVTCAPEHVPQPLVDQLKESGRLVIPLGREGTVQQLAILTKQDGRLVRRDLLDVRFVPMVRGKD